ncbi:CRISPR-associated endonuclease Cas1, partial [Klebsiella oxytoca]
MKHLIISEYGIYLGLESGRLVVKNKDDKKYFPLNRLATLSIAKKGVSFSSDLVEQFSLRGIKLFFLDFRGVAHSMLVGANQHAVVQA